MHIGFRTTLLKRNKHSILTGLGPTLIFRRNWHSKFDNYINSGYFKGNKDVFWQYKFLWYGGEIEYYYQLNENLEFSVGFIPGYPKFMSLSFGIRHLISEKE
ncbi:MAG: hypothetical protein IIB08_02975 [Bacteroidetes bacterium]|nr:hypothetical protein [Bacteroidota bacterium]